MDDKSSFISSWFELQKKHYRFITRNKRIVKEKIEFFKDAVRQKKQYPFHEQEFINRSIRKTVAQLFKWSASIMGVTFSGAYILIKKVKLPIRKSYIVNFSILIYAITIYKMSERIYVSQCDELLLKARNSQKKSESLLLKQAKIRLELPL